MTDAFYLPEGEGFRSTEHTVGPWAPDAQHGGPPAALLGRVMETHDRPPGFEVARATFEILRPIPITKLFVSAELVRGGKTVHLLAGSLSDERGELMRASLWRIRVGDAGVTATTEEDSPPSPTSIPEGSGPRTPHRCGYCEAVEWRFVEGGFDHPGPATAWVRMRYPLVPGEEPSPLTRVLVAADSGNGISLSVDPREFLFVNPELSVHLVRPASGEWVALKSRTHIAEAGTGVAESFLYDEKGRIGTGMQALVVRRRKD